ncbi:ester cyclase [Arthrobacter globiformis]|uniref:ester cyclase n=1 Tax=Arthrobacter globiformis TaxID=1665 RepID=UPI00278E8C94|nr:ester cyclase [Arthrobacter globiformis]MDQ0617326.1 hypothetical protein [Arthrobacter globiformis]
MDTLPFDSSYEEARASHGGPPERPTNTGPLHMGDKEIPATGKSVTATGAYFASVRDGKIVSFRAHPDVATMMGQLGLMPGM